MTPFFPTLDSLTSIDYSVSLVHIYYSTSYYKNNSDTLDPESVTPIDHLENEIAQFQYTGDILLLGDFNARTGNKCDFMDNNNLLNSSEVYNVLNKYSEPNIVKLGRAQRNNSDTKSLEIPLLNWPERRI